MTVSVSFLGETSELLADVCFTCGKALDLILLTGVVWVFTESGGLARSEPTRGGVMGNGLRLTLVLLVLAS